MEAGQTRPLSAALRVMQHPMLIGVMCIASGALVVSVFYLACSGSWAAAAIAGILAVVLCDAVTFIARRQQGAESWDADRDRELVAKYPALVAKTKRLAFTGFALLVAVMVLWVLSAEWGRLPAAIGTVALLPIWICLVLIPLYRLRHEPLA